MTRYIKQRNHYECAPVAILNALKWLGYGNVTRKDLVGLKRECRTTKDGTDSDGLHRVITKYIRRHRYIKCPTRRTLYDHLKNNRAFIFSYGYIREDGVEEWHTMLCDRIEPPLGLVYRMINDVIPATGELTSKTISYRDPQSMNHALCFMGANGELAEAWLI